MGLAITSRAVFELRPASDVLLVVATPGWITGQSYMIAAALLCRSPSVLLDGSPVAPPSRLAAMIERHRVSVLKAGSTFLRVLMTSMPGGESAAMLQEYDLSSLRLGTFCAEPVNDVVHRYAMRHLTPVYINSYWATEHGGMVWSRCHSHIEQQLYPDGRSWPLPWIAGEVLVCAEAEQGGGEQGGGGGWRIASDGEQGEVVIRTRFAYQALTIWQSQGFGTPGWCGDAERWNRYFEVGVGYVQGDAAARHAGGHYTFHGRSDEVINVGGNRIGTQEIESALLADTEPDAQDSPLLNCVVVGMADAILGTVSVAFVVLQRSSSSSSSMLLEADESRLRSLVRSRLGAVAVPAKFIVAGALPETHSGKFMRRSLRSMLAGAPLGDLSAVRNPECIEPLQLAVRAAIAPPPTLPVTAAAAPETLESLERMVLEVAHSLSATPHTSTLSTPLMDAGIDSLSATRFASELGQRTGLQLAPTLIYDHSTAAATARHLAQLLSASIADVTTPLAAPGLASSHFGTIGGVRRSGRPSMAGMVGAWPGCGASSAALPHLVQAGIDLVGEVPAQRWVASGADDASNEPLQRSRFLATVPGVELFDSAVFAIAPVEAAAMDPQQRLLLEHGYAAFHTCGISRADMLGRGLGVFLGITNADFAMLLLTLSVSVYAATGGAISVAAGRLSYVLGLHGPCESVDTACSSALTALHEAALCVGVSDCVEALTVAVGLVLVPHASISYARAGMLSTDGRCKTLDARANGYVRGEGVGGLVVGVEERLNVATSTLCSSVIQQDGQSASLTAPNGSAQAKLITLALAGAPRGLPVRRALQVEVHGTGTPLGDPTEVRALTQALHVNEAGAMLGGVKANAGQCANRI